MATENSIKQLARVHDSNSFVMLAHKYIEGKHVLHSTERTHQSIKDWWVSYKLDGVRARIYNNKLYSRTRRPLAAPESFCNMIMDIVGDLHVDGELIYVDPDPSTGGEDFNKAVSIARNFKLSSTETWQNMSYHIFDIVDNIPYEERYEKLRDKLAAVTPQINIVRTEATIVSSDTIPVWKSTAKRIGVEGLILRNPKAPYELGRSHNLLKVKSFQDMEVTVISLEKGEGKLSDMIGTLVCRLPNGKTVRVGTGLSEEERQSPPRVGDIITITFFEETPDGIPRFPVYKCIRNYE